MEQRELFQQIYAELRAIAARHMRNERADHTLSPTALVHEAYLKLGFIATDITRGHFVALAIRAMRQVLIDHARSRRRLKRASGSAKVSLDVLGNLHAPREMSLEDFFALDEAIRRLQEQDERMARITQLRCYGGLSVTETAAVLSISERTVKSDWALAKAWLARELGGAAADGPDAGSESDT